MAGHEMNVLFATHCNFQMYFKYCTALLTVWHHWGQYTLTHTCTQTVTVICINCTVPSLVSFLRTVGIFASAFRFFCSGFSLPSSPHPACPLARRIYFHATLAHCHRKCHTHTLTQRQRHNHTRLQLANVLASKQPGCIGFWL